MCTGAIDTVAAHKGSDQCSDCHQKGWDIPSADHFVVGKTDPTVCAVCAEFAMKQGHARFITITCEGMS